MNGAASGSAWKVTQDPGSGRPYYYKAGTKETAWVKPDELLTSAQVSAECSDVNRSIYTDIFTACDRLD